MSKLNYQIAGSSPVELVIEMGLGACISEWMPMARRLENQYGILLYERAGIHKSEASNKKRTPENIADELYELLQNVEHKEQIILLAHSQGGLYAQAFCRKYPEMVKGLVLLDPLSADDNRFKETLTAKEYKQSGVDKSANFKMMKNFAKLHMGAITKKMLQKAPPFYYYDGFSKKETKEILECADSVVHAESATQEYIEAHDEENIKPLKAKNTFPNIPLILVTHASEPAIEESMLFGNNSKEFAAKIEEMWQDIMKQYLLFSTKSRWIQAKRSTHYIHLMEPEIVEKALKEI